MKILVICLVMLIPNICFANEDFWGNTLIDGDRIELIENNHIKGEYIETDTDAYIRLDNGDTIELNDFEFEST